MNEMPPIRNTITFMTTEKHILVYLQFLRYRSSRISNLVVWIGRMRPAAKLDFTTRIGIFKLPLPVLRTIDWPPCRLELYWNKSIGLYNSGINLTPPTYKIAQHMNSCRLIIVIGMHQRQEFLHLLLFVSSIKILTYPDF